MRIAAGVLLAACAFAALAADPPPGPAHPGKVKAQMCATCHGPLGVSNAPDAPHLAGQPKIYLEAQLKAFRGGMRRHEVMNVIAKPLTDGEIESLSDWYSSLQVDAKERR